MVGGTVLGITRYKEQPGKYRIYIGGTREEKGQVDVKFIYVPANWKSPFPRSIRKFIALGDSVWWQSGLLLWTPVFDCEKTKRKYGEKQDYPFEFWRQSYDQE